MADKSESALRSYFQQGDIWEQEIIKRAKRSARVAWFFSIVFAGIALLSLLAVVLMLPLNGLVAWRERASVDWRGAGWITLGRFAGTFRAGAFARLAAAFDFEDAAFAAARGFAGRLAGAFPDRVAALLVLNFGSIRSPWRFLAMPCRYSIQNATDHPVLSGG